MRCEYFLIVSRYLTLRRLKGKVAAILSLVSQPLARLFDRQAS